MAGNTYAGKNLRIRIAGKTIFHATECSFTTSRNMESIASKDTNGEQVTPGNYSWGVSTNYLIANKPSGSTTQIGIKEILDIYQAGTQVEVQFTTDITGDVIITGNTFIEGLNMTAGTNGVATGDASFKGNGDFSTTEAIVLLPVMTSDSIINITNGVAGSFQVIASNGPMSIYGFTGSVSAPSNVSVNGATGLISWNTVVPTGTYVVSFVIANDAGALYETITFIVT